MLLLLSRTWTNGKGKVLGPHLPLFFFSLLCATSCLVRPLRTFSPLPPRTPPPLPPRLLPHASSDDDDDPGDFLHDDDEEGCVGDGVDDDGGGRTAYVLFRPIREKQIPFCQQIGNPLSSPSCLPPPSLRPISSSLPQCDNQTASRLSNRGLRRRKGRMLQGRTIPPPPWERGENNGKRRRQGRPR